MLRNRFVGSLWRENATWLGRRRICTECGNYRDSAEQRTFQLVAQLLHLRRPCTSTATSCPAPPGLTCAEPRHRAELRGALMPSTKKSSSTGPWDLKQMALACLRRHFTNAPFLLALEAKLGQPTPAPKPGKRNTGEASRSSAGCASTPDTIAV